MFWTSQGKLQTPLSQRDTSWESQTCIYTTSLERAHRSYVDASITSCHSLNENSVVVGDSNGGVRVFRTPDTQHRITKASSPLFLEYKVHSGPIQSIQVLPHLKAIYTISCRGCLFQWKYKALNWDQGLPFSGFGASKSQPISHFDEFPSYDMETMIEEMGNLEFKRHEGEEKTAKKKKKPRPWTRSIVAPTNFEPNDGDLPSSHLSLERIHGYSGSFYGDTGTRNNLHYCENCLIYNVGKVLVQYNVNDDTQEFCNAAGEITCLSVHPTTSICAIGQKHSSFAITIVDLDTMKPRTFLNGQTCGPSCLDFDTSGKFLVSASKAQVLAVYDWKNGTVVSSCRTYGQETLDTKFLRGSSDQLIECGVCFVRLWSLEGCSLVVKGDMELETQENHVSSQSHFWCTCIAFFS